MLERLRGAFVARPRGDAGPRHRIHALVFGDPEGCLEATKRLAGEGYAIADVHTPFPLHGLEHVRGFSPPGVAAPTLVGGTVGLLFAIGLQLYTHAFAWPLNIGGKTFTALPSLVPVAFELTVLVAGFFTVGALLLRARLWPRIRGGAVPPLQPHPAVNDDKFVILVAEAESSFSPARFHALLGELRPEAVHEAWRVI